MTCSHLNNVIYNVQMHINNEIYNVQMHINEVNVAELVNSVLHVILLQGAYQTLQHRCQYICIAAPLPVYLQ